MPLPPEAAVLPQHLLDCAQLVNDRALILPRLPKGATFVEVGVGLGIFTRQVLEQCEPARFIAIDNFELDRLPFLWGKPISELLEGKTHRSFYEDQFRSHIDAGRMQVIAAESATGLTQLADLSADIIYLDADHRYEFVKADLDAALPKLRPDGWLILNDYIMVAMTETSDIYGVVHAGNEFMIEHGWGIDCFALQSRMFCDVALRKYPFDTASGRDVAHLRDVNAAMQNSTSWKLTRPIRALSGLFK